MYVWILVCDNPNSIIGTDRYAAYSFPSEVEAQNALMHASSKCQGTHTIHRSVVEIPK